MYKPLYDRFSGEDYKIAEKIQRRRLQILLHSYLYYELNTNLISDHTFDKWEGELVKLQKSYPDIAAQVDWAEAFEDWDGSTGAFLPYSNPITVSIAHLLLGKDAEVSEVVETKQITTRKKVSKKLF